MPSFDFEVNPDAANPHRSFAPFLKRRSRSVGSRAFSSPFPGGPESPLRRSGAGAAKGAAGGRAPPWSVAAPACGGPLAPPRCRSARSPAASPQLSSGARPPPRPGRARGSGPAGGGRWGDGAAAGGYDPIALPPQKFRRQRLPPAAPEAAVLPAHRFFRKDRRWMGLGPYCRSSS